MRVINIGVKIGFVKFKEASFTYGLALSEQPLSVFGTQHIRQAKGKWFHDVLRLLELVYNRIYLRN